MVNTSDMVSFFPKNFTNIAIDAMQIAEEVKEKAIALPNVKSVKLSSGLSITTSAPLQTYNGIPIRITRIMVKGSWLKLI